MTALELPTAQPAAAGLTRLRMLCVLFFLSGFPALIYQLTWQRSLFRIFGVNTESVTIVVTAFMVATGISRGGEIFSRATRSMANPHSIRIAPRIDRRLIF